MENETLLEVVGIVVIPATREFVAGDLLELDRSADARIRVAWIGTTFGVMLRDKTVEATTECTLQIHRLRKPLTDGAVIAALSDDHSAELTTLGDQLIEHFVTLERLARELGDAIVSEADTDELAIQIRKHRATQLDLQQQRNTLLAEIETTPANLFALLEMQGKGEDGALLTNGFANIFYLRDVHGTLRSIHLMWSSDGWLLYCYPPERPHRWSDGYQVFSQVFSRK
jgi:hypothetical protein